MNETLYTAALILGVIFLLIFVFVWLHKRGHNKKVAKQKIVLADIVWKNKLQLSTQETINNRLIAIDKINFMLLYIDFSSEKEKVTLIDLWQVKNIKLTTEDNSIYEEKKGRNVLVEKQVSSLQIEIIFLDAQQNASLVLYEYKDGMHNFVDIKKRADYWSQQITTSVNELPHASRKASTYA